MIDFDKFEALSFDCYGTLIDWETGLLQALRPILSQHDVNLDDESLLELYGQIEPEVEQPPHKIYKTVLKIALSQLGEHLNFTPSQDELKKFSRSVTDWPTFDDSAKALQQLGRKFKLIILSNIDDDLFAHSQQKLSVAFDEVFTAEQIGSYKPSLKNFEYLFEHSSTPREKILHVAQSLYHDHVPAKQMGLTTVWINRRAGKTGFGATFPAEAQPDLELPDLQSLADLIP